MVSKQFPETNSRWCCGINNGLPKFKGASKASWPSLPCGHQELASLVQRWSPPPPKHILALPPLLRKQASLLRVLLPPQFYAYPLVSTSNIHVYPGLRGLLTLQKTSQSQKPGPWGCSCSTIQTHSPQVCRIQTGRSDFLNASRTLEGKAG